MYRNGTRGRRHNEGKRSLIYIFGQNLGRGFCSTVVLWLFSQFFRLAGFILGEIFLIWCGNHQVARLPFNLGRRLLSYGNHKRNMVTIILGNIWQGEWSLYFYLFKIVVNKGKQQHFRILDTDRFHKVLTSGVCVKPI